MLTRWQICISKNVQCRNHEQVHNTTRYQRILMVLLIGKCPHPSSFSMFDHFECGLKNSHVTSMLRETTTARSGMIGRKRPCSGIIFPLLYALLCRCRGATAMSAVVSIPNTEKSQTITQNFFCGCKPTSEDEICVKA